MDRIPLLLFLLLWSFNSCSSLNDEGMVLLRLKSAIEVDPLNSLSDWTLKSINPCGWNGIKCEDGRVSYLSLRDFHLTGSLVPELGQLYQLRYLILRNNCLYGIIPKELGNLQKLEVLDLSHNDFTGTVPSNLAKLSSLKSISIQGNPFVEDRNLGLHNLCTLADAEVDGLPKLTDLGELRRRLNTEARGSGAEKAVRVQFPPPSVNSGGGSIPSGPSTRSQQQQSPSPPPPSPPPPSPPVANTTSIPVEARPVNNRRQRNSKVWLAVVLVAISSIMIIAVGIYYYHTKKTSAIKPWAIIGLSGQLQKAFVAGVSELRRAELEQACEDFSNVVAELSDCTLYKGRLSSGVEIVVASTVVNSAKDWSPIYETQFRKKISTLSKINHKNFSNLLGYCAEDEPFTRMMVFEYAPNGTLHESLHARDTEDLGWTARLRIAIGVSYCLEHMSQLTPPVVLGKLTSTSIGLTDDSAGKISDFEFWSETAETTPEIRVEKMTETVYQFGMLLLEIMAGRPPVLAWAEDYLRGTKPSSELVNGGVKGYKEDDVAALCQLVVQCCNATSQLTLTEVNARLREVTGMAPEAAVPKTSPLWWAELEIAKG